MSNNNKYDTVQAPTGLTIDVGGGVFEPLLAVIVDKDQSNLGVVKCITSNGIAPDGAEIAAQGSESTDAAAASASAAATSEANALSYRNAAQTAETNAETAETGAETAQGLAEDAQAAAEAAQTAAEAARDAANAGANVYADITTGRAAVSDGAQFMVVDGAEIVRYRRDSGSTQTEMARYPTSSAYAEALAAPIKRELTFISGTANVAMTNDDTYSRVSGTASPILSFSYTAEDLAERDAARPITLRVPVTGTFSDTPDYQEFNSGGTGIGSRVDMTLVGSEYVVTYTPNAAAVSVRIRWSATAAATMSRPYIVYQSQSLANLNSSIWRRMVEKWANDVVDLSGDLFGTGQWVNGVGSGLDQSSDGRFIYIPAGTRADANVPCRGVLRAGDTFTLIGEIVSNPGYKMRDMLATPTTGLGGGSGTAVRVSYRYGNLFIITGLASGAASGNPAYLSMQFDNRTLDATFTATDVKIKFHAMFRGTISPHKLTDMAALRRAIVAKREQIARVDPRAVAGTKNTYANLVDALRMGHRSIILKGDEHYRCEPGLSVNNKTAIIWRSGTQVETAKPIISTARSLAPGDWTATGADANVYYYALAATPARLYEVSGSTVTRMGIEVAAPTAGAWRIGANEAEVRSTIGNFWWGAGSEGTGVYMRPFGDTTVGKTWELPIGVRALELTNCETRLEFIDARYATADTIYASGGVLSTRGIQTGYGGNNGCQMDNGCHWIDIEEPSLATDAGNDGWGAQSSTTNPVHWTLGRTRSVGNVYDGFAPHGGYIYVTSLGKIYAQGNGKQGFVSIVAGYYNFDIESCGNRDIAVLIQLGTVTEDTIIKANEWLADSVNLSHNTASKVSGKIERIISKTPQSFNIFASSVNIEVGEVKAFGDDYAGAVAAGVGVRVTAGTVKIDRCEIRRFATGINLTGGTLNLGGGNVLRNTTGILQSGGTLGVDLNRPLNVYGNGTQFSGVSAPDQAKTISVQVP